MTYPPNSHSRANQRGLSRPPVLPNQRGLSLVELMIILVVVGIVLGGTIIPFQAIWKNDAYKKEEARMERIHTAILGYAVRHQTREEAIEITNLPTTGRLGPNRFFTLPAGRPYLPCPDANGDGVEDRAGVVNSSQEVFTDFGERSLVAIPRLSSPRADSPFSTRGDTITQQGGCSVTRGILPWLSLGVHPADLWGNRYTFAVDNFFGHGLVGFNQESISDEFDPVQMSDDSVDTTYTKLRERVETTNNRIRANGAQARNQNHPLVVCDEVVEECISLHLASLVLAAGELAPTAYSAPRRDYAQYDITNGVPYVLVSHGYNGHGAVHHARTQRTVAGLGYSTALTRGIRCNDPFNGLSVGQEVPEQYLDEALNLPYTSYLTADSGVGPRCAGNMLRNGAPISGRYFQARPRSVGSLAAGADPSDFDDIVHWRTKDEIFRQLSYGKVLPAPTLPHIRPYITN